MNGNDAKRGKVTAENKAEAARLKAIWTATADSRRATGMHTQGAFGDAYDIGNQSAVGFFLNGQTALSLKAARGFAKGLGCHIADFSPRLAAEIDKLTEAQPSAQRAPDGPATAHEHRPPTALDLPEALNLLGMALAATPANRREALATNLAGWARDGGADHWRLVVLNLLNQGGTAKHRAA